MLALVATTNQIIDATKNEIADTHIQKIHNTTNRKNKSPFNSFYLFVDHNNLKTLMPYT